MSFFQNVKTIQEAKQLYKKLALQYHPDRGGDTATMQAINAEFHRIIKHLPNENGKTAENSETAEDLQQFTEILNKILPLDGLIIEIVGRWIWISGNTYPHRSQLLEAGCRFAPKKRVWYYRNDADRCPSSKNKTLEQIKSKYGSIKINSGYKQLS